MLTNPISVAIIDVNTLFRSILSNYLIRESGLHSVFEGSCLSDLLYAGANLSFDILIADIPFDEAELKEIFGQLKLKYPLAKILLLSMFTDVDRVSYLLKMGVHGCISKNDDPQDLLEAISTIVSGQIYRNSLFTEALYHRQQDSLRINQQNAAISLSEREKALLKFLWEEKNNRQIADEFLLSVRSVEKLKQDLKGKLRVRSSVGLLKYAIEKNIYAVMDDFSKSPNQN